MSLQEKTRLNGRVFRAGMFWFLLGGVHSNEVVIAILHEFCDLGLIGDLLAHDVLAKGMNADEMIFHGRPRYVIACAIAVFEGLAIDTLVDVMT